MKRDEVLRRSIKENSFLDEKEQLNGIRKLRGFLMKFYKVDEKKRHPNERMPLFMVTSLKIKVLRCL